MCILPNHVWVDLGSKWEKQPVACRQCWRCKENRVNDYVGRAMCETSVSLATVTLSLTYAPRDDLADKVLTPRHFQLFMKLLRRAGHKVRYLVAGEYGDLKSRAHFHAILFFTHIAPNPTGEIPGWQTWDAPFCREIPQKRMVHIREWPHGHIKCDWNADEKAARYVCKYLLADDKNNAWFSLSKKPTLGAAWFVRKAEMAVGLSVMPSSFEYSPPGGDREKSYLMTGATRRDYMNAISTDEALKPRLSEWVLKSFEKYRKAEAEEAEARADAALSTEEMLEQMNLARDQRRKDHAISTLAPDQWLAAYPGYALENHRGKFLPRPVIDRLLAEEREKNDCKKASKSFHRTGQD